MRWQQNEAKKKTKCTNLCGSHTKNSKEVGVKNAHIHAKSEKVLAQLFLCANTTCRGACEKRARKLKRAGCVRKYINRLPGQGLVHSTFWRAFPTQLAPPLSGAGAVHWRCRLCWPRPQRLLHSLHGDHGVHPPLTKAETTPN